MLRSARRFALPLPVLRAGTFACLADEQSR